MDLTTAIIKRRSIRKYLDKPVEIATLGGILEVAKEAPSSSNIQNWKFIIVTDPKIKTRIVNACMGQTWINTAPALIIICGDTSFTKSETCTIQNTAIITTLIMLKAAELGLGTCWIGSFDPNAVSGILRLPDKIKPYVVMPIGYPHPDEKYKAHKRISIEKLIWFDRYGRENKIAKKVKRPILKRIKSFIRK